MERECHFNLGGVDFFLKAFEEEGMQPFSNGFYHLFPAKGSPDIKVEVLFTDPDPLPQGKVLFEAKGNWRLIQQNGSLHFETFDLQNGDCIQTARLNLSLTKAEVNQKPHWVSINEAKIKSWSLAKVMAPLGKMMLAHFLSLGSKRGFLCHSTAVDDHGDGLLFVGRSGSGKSTMFRFWKGREGVTPLGDEQIIVRREEGRYFLYGTPWPGDNFEIWPHRVELKKIYLISHAPRHRLVPHSPLFLLRKIFVNLFLPYWKKEAIDSTLSFLEELLSHVPCFVLGFAKDENIVEFIRQNDAA